MGETELTAGPVEYPCEPCGSEHRHLGARHLCGLLARGHCARG
jgi:hypothetical protein